MPSKIEYDKLYMDIAKRIAMMSKAERLKVGSIIVKNHSIISYGYNGTPYGEDNSCETKNGDELITKPDVIHSELNSVLKLIGMNINENVTMYITHSPCLHCSRFIFQAGIIKEIVYEEEYRDSGGIDWLKSKGISVRKMDQ